MKRDNGNHSYDSTAAVETEQDFAFEGRLSSLKCRWPKGHRQRPSVSDL